MTRTFGTLLLGAAVLSLFAPRQRAAVRSIAPRRQLAAGEPRMLYALVQTRPQVVVLALSGDPDELRKEMAELDQTWNHWDLRSERHRYEIQPAPVLVRSGEPALAG